VRGVLVAGVCLLCAVGAWFAWDPPGDRRAAVASREQRGVEVERAVRRAVTVAACHESRGRSAMQETRFTIEVRVSATGHTRVAAIDVERDPTAQGEVAPETLDCVSRSVERLRLGDGLAINVRMPITIH